jgi:hypothetical protein
MSSPDDTQMPPPDGSQRVHPEEGVHDVAANDPVDEPDVVDL